MASNHETCSTGPIVMGWTKPEFKSNQAFTDRQTSTGCLGHPETLCVIRKLTKDFPVLHLCKSLCIIQAFKMLLNALACWTNLYLPL